MTLQPNTFADAFANNLPATDLLKNAMPAIACSRRRTILLVEDDPFVREATGNLLKHSGFEVLPAEDAQAAMKIYEACGREFGRERGRRIDLVMTDMILPGRTGQQLAQDLRRCSPEIVVLITSGYFNPEYETEDPESRTYFLAKPYSRRTLIDKIEKILATAVAKPVVRPATQAG